MIGLSVVVGRIQIDEMVGNPNLLCSVNSAFSANSSLNLLLYFLAWRRLHFSTRQLRHQEFHHRPRLGPTTFQPVIRISQRVQSGQQPVFRNLARIL